MRLMQKAVIGGIQVSIDVKGSLIGGLQVFIDV